VPSLSNVFIYLNFKIHQDEIVKNWCVQREMENNKCNGHCYLSKQLEKQAKKEKKEADSLREKQDLFYTYSSTANQVSVYPFIKKNTIIISRSCEKSKLIRFGIFRPPLV
jgi:hypothetical protein